MHVGNSFRFPSDSGYICYTSIIARNVDPFRLQEVSHLEWTGVGVFVY